MLIIIAVAGLVHAAPPVLTLQGDTRFQDAGAPTPLTVTIEASGVPLVATRTGMAEDVVEDGANGYLAPVDDVEAIVTRARSLLGEGAPDFAARGRLTAEAYDWSIVSEVLYDSVYRELVA